MTASLVLGQSNFTNNGPGVNTSNLTRPEGVAFDSAGDIWVASEGSGRVTEFRPPFSNGMNASLIIGQAAFGGPSTVGSGPTNLSGPVGISFDASGDLWVAEFLNNRVTEFRPPFSDGEAASIALGQSTLTGNQGNTTAVNLSAPQAIQFDAHGDAWVSDWNNARALEYLAPLSTARRRASFSASRTSQPPAARARTASGTSAPSCSTLTGTYGRSTTALKRVVGFVGPTFANYEAPTIVIGQPNLTTTASEGGAVGLQNPQGAVFDSAGNLWVDDIGDHRVLEFVAAAPASTSSLRFLLQLQSRLDRPGNRRGRDRGRRGGVARPAARQALGCAGRPCPMGALRSDRRCGPSPTPSSPGIPAFGASGSCVDAGPFRDEEGSAGPLAERLAQGWTLPSCGKHPSSRSRRAACRPTRTVRATPR